jgi:hypothetical protein
LDTLWQELGFLFIDCFAIISVIVVAAVLLLVSFLTNCLAMQGLLTAIVIR